MKKSSGQKTDISQSPINPQFQLGATSSDAEIANEIADNDLQNQGGIVDRLGQQFQIPRAQTDAQTGERGYGGNNLGEIG